MILKTFAHAWRAEETPGLAMVFFRRETNPDRVETVRIRSLYNYTDSHGF